MLQAVNAVVLAMAPRLRVVLSAMAANPLA